MNESIQRYTELERYLRNIPLDERYKPLREKVIAEMKRVGKAGYKPDLTIIVKDLSKF